MNLSFRDRKNDLEKFIPLFKNRERNFKDAGKFPEAVSSINIQSSKNLKELDTAFFFDYRIFPDNILTYKAEWEKGKRMMEAGDLIVQQAYLPPIKMLSQKVVFAVRIIEVIRETNKIGFSYETLQGHAESGISTFTLEQGENEQIIFKIHTRSVPGNLLAKILGPLFTLPYQRFCTRMALVNVKRQLEAS